MPVDAVLTLPGSKSVTNRALILAALADGPSRLRGALRARDTILMADALRALGVDIVDDVTDWVVTPAPLHGPAHVDCGLAGTVMRFVPPLAALADGEVRFDGDPRARERPLSPLLDALCGLGVDLDHGGRGTLPVVVRGMGSVAGGTVDIDASASSQFVSALLLSGARYQAGVTVRHTAEGPGEQLPSRPHVAMTIAMLRERGVRAEEAGPATWRVPPSAVAPRDVHVEPDLSNAAPFLAAALVTNGRVAVPAWPLRTHQPGDRLRGLLTAAGGSVGLGSEGVSVSGRGAVHGVDVDLRDAGELVPVLTALAALADGPSRLRGIAHLRGHESDRLAVLAGEINNLGGDVSETSDGLAIRPRPLRAGTLDSHGDHRIAQAGAVLGLVVPGLLVRDVAATDKTLPDFVGRWARMLAGRARG